MSILITFKNLRKHLRSIINTITFFSALIYLHINALDITISIEEALRNYDMDNNKHILTKSPENSSTVGVILLSKQDNGSYILLGRERVDGNNKSKAGTFSELGGSAKPKDGSFLAQMLRELNEESVDSIKINPDNFMDKAYIIYKNNKGRDVLYGIYPVDKNEFTSAEYLNKIRQNAADMPEEYIEKDLFLWAEVSELLNLTPNQEYIKLHDTEGREYNIRLRKYFIEDCLTHKDFYKIVSNILEDDTESYIIK